MKAGRRITCPVPVLWGEEDDVEDLDSDPLAIWRDWADEVQGRGLGCDHHLSEKALEEPYQELHAFFS